MVNNGLKENNIRMKFFTEDLYSEYNQKLKIKSIIAKKRSQFQNILIFNSKVFGKVLTLDGVIQITERDHYGYSEMLSHVPIVAHNFIKKVLIIGGGDGAIAHEVLKHKSIKEIILCEIDKEVINLSKKYLTNINFNSLENSKVKIIIQDASELISNNNFKNYFDLVIVDRPDPIGPGKKLFQKKFYKNINNIISDKGVAVFQTGIPFFQKNELQNTVSFLKLFFQLYGIYLTVVPSYAGGFMALTWASNKIDISQINKKSNTTKLKTLYYSTKIHNSAFILPTWLINTIK